MAGGSGLSGELPASTEDKFLSMVALLADPEALRREYERLSAERTAVAELVAAAGPASEILQLREQATQDRATAAQLLADARIQVEQLLADARVEKQRIIDESAVATNADVARLERAKAAADAANNDALLSQQAADAAIQALATKQQELDTYTALIDLRLENVAEQERESDARKQRLDEAFVALKAVTE